MGLLSNPLRTGAGIFTLGGSELLYYGPNDAAKRQKAYQDEQYGLRQQQKQNQLGLLGQMKGPQISDATRKRIAALEAESAEGPLAADPLFQSDRQQLVGGAQAALSGVQNRQLGNQVSGGFQNVGSQNDVYDRLGGQLASLAQESRKVKESKRAEAASLQQQITDNQLAFENAKIQAQMAIEAGDAAAANAALAQAYEAQNKIASMQANAIGMGLSIGGAVLGASGGPAGAAAGSQAGDRVGSMLAQSPSSESFSLEATPQSRIVNSPYSYTRKY